MKMNNEINSLSELYELLLPALRSKKRELRDLKYYYITEKDIWDYIKTNNWINETNLTLADMVDDILHTENEKIAAYVASKIENERSNNTEE